MPVTDPRSAFEATDKNRDGEIDHAEFQNRITEVFYFADQDKDGFTTGQGDCNDHIATIHPGAAEICDGTSRGSLSTLPIKPLPAGCANSISDHTPAPDT